MHGVGASGGGGFGGGGGDGCVVVLAPVACGPKPAGTTSVMPTLRKALAVAKSSIA